MCKSRTQTSNPSRLVALPQMYTLIVIIMSSLLVMSNLPIIKIIIARGITVHTLSSIMFGYVCMVLQQILASSYCGKESHSTSTRLDPGI